MVEHLSNAEIWGSRRPRLSFRAWLAIIRVPLVLAAAGFFLWPFAAIASPAAATIGFNVSRYGLMVWAGFLVARHADGRLLATALAGVAVMVVDHVLLKGGWFLIEYARGSEVAEWGPNSYLLAFGGVLISFVMFSPLAALAGLCGGMWGPSRRVPHAA